MALLCASELAILPVASAEPILGADSASFSACHNEHTFSRAAFDNFSTRKRAVSDPLLQLYEWCAADKRCAEAYHIDSSGDTDNTENQQKANRRVFEYLASKWLDSRVDLMRPLDNNLCASQSLDALLRDAWLLEMRLQSHENARVQCGNNERFIFSTETMEGHCVCIEDRNCDGGGNWRANAALNYSTISIVVVAFVLVVILLVSCCAAYSRHRVYQQLMFTCQNKCGGRERFRKHI